MILLFLLTRRLFGRGGGRSRHGCVVAVSWIERLCGVGNETTTTGTVGPDDDDVTGSGIRCCCCCLALTLA